MDQAMDPFDAGMLALERNDLNQARTLLAQAHTNARACLLLGQLASAGNGEPANPAKAAAMYTRAAELGNAEAAYNMGAFHATGRGVPQDLGKALWWYRRSAELGDIDALRTIGTMHANGEGTPVNMDEAERAWRAAAEQGQRQALLDLGRLYHYHRRDPIAAADWYLQGGRYESGNTAGEALRQLQPELRALADSGNIRAKTLLGAFVAFYLGDQRAALPLLNEAAAAGDAEAQRTVAFLVQDNEPDRAAELYLAAAQGGDKIAAYNVAVTSSQANNVTDCIHWARVAATRGVSEAYTLLANTLGTLNTSDADAEALGWLVKAAQDGHAGAMFATASWYRDGYGTKVDLVQSLRWFLAAYGAGNGDAIHESHPIVEQLSPAEIRRAGSLADQRLAAETFIQQRGRRAGAVGG